MLVARGCKSRMMTKQPAVTNVVTLWLSFHPARVVSAHVMLWRLLWEDGTQPSTTGCLLPPPSKVPVLLAGHKIPAAGLHQCLGQASGHLTPQTIPSQRNLIFKAVTCCKPKLLQSL